jgi:SAM-dependent methyltransferase
MDTEHEFDDRAYVRQWAATADQRRPERSLMFQRIVELLRAVDVAKLHVVELGCGPGTLADAILSGIPQATYEGLDYSRPMLELAQERLALYGERPTLHAIDLRRGDWPDSIGANVNAIVTNQALHDLGSAEAVADVYRIVHSKLPGGGLFINAELVVPAGGSANKPGKLPLERHLQLLRERGFSDVRAELAFGEYVAIVATKASSQ